MRKKRARTVAASLIIAILVLAIVALWIGPLALYSNNQYARYFGRCCLSCRVRLGIVGPSLLLKANDAAILASVGIERYETMEIVQKGYHKMSQAEKDIFMKEVERRILESSSFDYADNLAADWGKEISVDTIRRGFLSENPDVRLVADRFFLDSRPDLSREFIVRTIGLAFTKGLELKNDGMLQDAMLLAQALEARQFIKEHEQRIQELTKSNNALVQREAKVCLLMLERPPRSRPEEKQLPKRPTRGPWQKVAVPRTRQSSN